MEVRKTSTFFGVELGSVDFMYTAEAYGRVFYIHPEVISQNGGKFEFPIYNVDVVEVSGKKAVIVPGGKIMRIFEVGEGEIEDAYGCQTMSYYVFDKAQWRDIMKAVIIVAEPEEPHQPTIEWVDGNGNRWISIMDIHTGAVKTAPNTNPPPEEEED